MNRHRRKNFNPIDASSLARWIVIIAFLATTGLSYVYLTVQLHHQGVQRRLLEQELIATRLQNEDAKCSRRRSRPRRTPATSERRLP
jgi:hypothetical protein